MGIRCPAHSVYGICEDWEAAQMKGKEDKVMTQEGTRTLYRAGSLRLSEGGGWYRVSDERDGVETLLFETDNPAAAVSSFCGTVETRIRLTMIARMGKSAFYRWDQEENHE